MASDLGDLSNGDARSDAGLGTLIEAGPHLGSQPGASPNATPNDDEDVGGEMTLIEHLEELRRRILIALVSVAVFSVIGFVFWSPILRFLLIPLPAAANRLAGPGQNALVATGITEPFMIALKLAIAVGIIVAAPVLLYEGWAFIAPALTRREKKYAFPFTLLGVVLFAAGLGVGFITLRYPIDWLVGFGGNQFTLLIDANNYFTFVAYFLIAFGIVFELPLVVTFLGIVGVVNSRVLREKRMVILFGLWFLSCFITPGADPYSPVIIGVSFTILFELSVLLLRILKK